MAAAAVQNEVEDKQTLNIEECFEVAREVTTEAGKVKERVHLRNTHTRLRSANEGNTDMGVP